VREATLLETLQERPLMDSDFIMWLKEQAQLATPRRVFESLAAWSTEQDAAR
jgi:hypothetical protein